MQILKTWYFLVKWTPKCVWLDLWPCCSNITDGTICYLRPLLCTLLTAAVAHTDHNTLTRISWQRRYNCYFYKMKRKWVIGNGLMSDSINTVKYHGWPSTQPGTCTQPCPIVHTAVPHCSHSRAPGEQWARLCVFTLQGCVQAARLCRGSPVNMW